MATNKYGQHAPALAAAALALLLCSAWTEARPSPGQGNAAYATRSAESKNSSCACNSTSSNREYEDGAGLVQLNTTAKPYCTWGGYNVTDMPWALPRDAVYQGDWYCNMTGGFREQVQEGREDEKGYEFVLYGDSLTQCLRNHGDNCKGAVDWFNRGWGKDHRSINWALGGDNPSTLMWRLANGGSPEGTGAKLAFVMIGSNALYDGVDYEAVKNETAYQITQVAGFLANSTPCMEVMLLGLLPKTGYTNGSPTGKQTDAIKDTNAWINNKLEEYAEEHDGVTYVYCGDAFLLEDGETLNEDLTSDGLHPNGEGWAKIGECVKPIMDKYLGDPDTDEDMDAQSIAG